MKDEINRKWQRGKTKKENKEPYDSVQQPDEARQQAASSLAAVRTWRQALLKFCGILTYHSETLQNRNILTWEILVLLQGLLLCQSSAESLPSQSLTFQNCYPKH